MCKWYKEMNCYVVASPESDGLSKIEKMEQKALLEQTFRNYAAVFDKVKIVISKSQAKEHFQNFPHIIQNESATDQTSLHTLADDATSEAIFIGSSDFYDFPISLLANLIKAYDGELFMGYKSTQQQQSHPAFGIYHTSLFSQKNKTVTIDSLDKKSYRLLPLPEISFNNPIY